MRHYGHSQFFVPTAEQDASVRYLDRLRNDLTHYGGATRIVRVAELPRMLLDCIGVVEWLLEDSNNVTIYEQEDGLLARDAIRATKEELRRLSGQWPPAGPERV